MPTTGAILGVSAVATPATTGTQSIQMSGASVFTITPTGACTFNASGGVPGARVTFVISTSGTNSFNMNFNSNFKAAGVLATGTQNNRTFAITFVYTGALWVEMGRTAAMQ
jgi:hypothetical protein